MTNVHNTNHWCEVTVGVGHFVVQKQLFLSPKNDSFCTHLLNSSHVVAVCLFWLFILFLLSQEGAFYGSVYISMWTFFPVWKNVWDLWVCVYASLICCCHSEWEAATLFGNEECFPCLSPSASALAATSVYKTLSAIVLYTERLLASKRLQQGPSLSLPF